MIGPVIDGSFAATTRDVDDWIERKGNIESAFDGMRAAAGAGTQINSSQGVFLTEKVAFAFFPQSDYSWLVVVNRSNPAHTVGFRADAERLIHRQNDVHDNTYSVRVGQIRRAIESYRPLSFAPQNHELVPVSRQVVQSDVVPTETACSVPRAPMQGVRWDVVAMVVIVFVAVGIGGVVFAVNSQNQSHIQNKVMDIQNKVMDTMIDKMLQIHNRSETQGVQIKVLQQDNVGIRNELEDHGREIRINTRKLRDLEDRTQPQLAIEGPPNKTLGNDAGSERQPKEGSVFDQFINGLGYLVFIAAVAFAIIYCIAQCYLAEQAAQFKRE
jgi:hypothetical protein